MKWFTNLSTRVKLILGFGVMWLLMAVVIVVAYLSIAEITESEKELGDVHFKIALQLLQLQSGQNLNRGQMLEMTLTAKKADQEKIAQEIRDTARQNDESIKALLKLDPDPQFQARLKEILSHRDMYRQTREQEFTLIRQGKVEEARRLGIGIQDERFDKIRAIARELGDKASKGADRRLALDMQAAKRSIVIFLIIGVFAFFLGGVMTILLNRSIAGPLVKLIGSAERIAAGDLNIDLAAGERRDEVGTLMQAFSRMTQSLRAMAGVAGQITAGDLRVNVQPQSEKDLLGNALAQMITNLRRSTAEIAEAVNLLGSAASEILAATTQVASSTAETATAISETTATVEEVRQAAQLSSQKAKNVSDSAQQVAQITQTGQQAVEETAAVMRHIRDQMESIAKTIVRLNEQGQSIGGIIASVTDIADQSNLLAVNAAIEAAKAGEQGKGFAVVAQEIKSLAEQSKQATAEVRGILNDVQKATSAAVMATEQGSKAVEAGAKQSAQAGEAIRLLAESSREAAQAAFQIVASIQQQVVGMDQIGTAMENINQAGAETAASMRQSEVSAQNLHELGQKLKLLVEQYKL